MQKVYVAPGNAGTALEDGVENVAITTISTDRFVQREDIYMTVVGPEAPLAQVSWMRSAPPDKYSARPRPPRSWKVPSFAKRFLVRHNIPTAFFETFSDIAAARAMSKHGAPIVIKADGLAAGKGVVVAMNR